MILIVTFLGILIHFLGPFHSKMIVKIMHKNPGAYRKLFKYITPQRSYDITTIVAAFICCSVIFQELFLDIKNGNNVYGILFFGLLGIIFPVAIWKIKKRQVLFNGNESLNIDSLIFLPLTALSEELIWRFCVPSLLLMYLSDSLTLSILVSSIGFVILHLPLGGFKSIAYISLFTTFAVLSFLNFGILAAIAFHITHNLVIQFFRPVKQKTFTMKNPTVSESEW
jgi:hypothetical protein